MKELACPVCSKELVLFEKIYRCESNHCFDLSKYGVLNLALSNKSSKKRHGDDKNMVIARKDFLDGGYYEAIRKSVCCLSKKYCNNAESFVDAGCGEGYYTEFVANSISAEKVYGVDISKDALRYFKKRLPNSLPIIASIFKMPLKTDSVDFCLSMFAPDAFGEVRRILKKDGIFIKTKVLKNHLFELKEAVYDTPYYNDEFPDEAEGFEIIDSLTDDYKIRVVGEDIKKLFLMTPYYYKTSEKDQKKLDKLRELTTTVSVKTLVYRKSDS